MDTHKYNDNDTFYRQKFDDYEVELPSDDWDVFSLKLAEAQPKRRRFAFYYIATAASVIGVIFLGFSLLNKQDKPTKLILAKQEINRPKLQQKAFLASNVSTTTVTPQNRVATSTSKAQASNHTSTAQNSLSVKNSGIETGTTATVAASSHASQASTIPTSVPQTEIAQNKVVTDNFDTTGYITHPVPQYAELPALPTDKPEKNKKQPSGSNNLVTWLAGTFQGNMGLTSGSSDNLTSDGSIGSQLFSRVSQAELLSGSSTPNLITFSGKKTYYVPLSVGISVGISLCKRWELQSGIIYTRLITTGELGAQYSGGSKATGRIEQHYLGIPVSLAYSFIQKPSFAIYLIGGGRIEKGLSLVEKIYTYNTQNTPTEQERYHYSIKGVQLSLDAGVGASYRLYRFIHWYVETGGAWYIPGNQPESSRTEHPLNVSFKTGLKFSLSK
ncbi:MAG: hypothetical protein H6Q17_2503 [Bacteroidetes bacterium]|nr:hypothetical protein [Bacteroidota bacterium]